MIYVYRITNLDMHVIVKTCLIKDELSIVSTKSESFIFRPELISELQSVVVEGTILVK